MDEGEIRHRDGPGVLGGGVLGHDADGDSIELGADNCLYDFNLHSSSTATTSSTVSTTSTTVATSSTSTTTSPSGQAPPVPHCYYTGSGYGLCEGIVLPMPGTVVLFTHPDGSA